MSQGRDQQVQFSVHTIGTEHPYKGDGPCYSSSPASVLQAIPPHHEQQKIWRLYVIASYFMWEKIKTGVTILSCTAGSPGETEENLPTRGLSEQSDESRVLRRELF